jgi:hypothetical protein
MSKIKTFRGQIPSGGIDTVTLHTNTGSTGYRLLSLQCITNDPTAYDIEGVFKIYKIPQAVSSVSADIDFNDQTLLAAAYVTFGNQPYEVNNVTTIFDREVFNQDLYITFVDNGGNTRPMNYYFELEQMTIDLNENTVATLKDIRNITAPSVT